MPLVAPETTTVPPGRSERSECAHVASPTVSITASTRAGQPRARLERRVGAELDGAARLASSRLVTHTWKPIASASWIAAVATPPPAPWMSTVSPTRSPDFVASMR